MTYIIYNTYMTYIIIYITASSTSSTSSNLSNLTSLTTSSSSPTTQTTSPTSATGDQLLGNSYNTWKMSFKQELTCRWSTSTWTPTRLLTARSFAQKLLHRSSENFPVIKLYLNSCKIRLLQFLYFSLAAGTARQWHKTLPSAACRTPKRVAKYGSCLSLGNPLRRSCVSDGQTCGKMQIWWGPAHPLHTKWGSTVKIWCKIVILKVQMQAWHEKVKRQ